MYLIVVSLGIGFYSLIWLLAGFSTSFTLGLSMSGVYISIFLLGTYLYRRYKRNWEWEQGAIMRKMEAFRLSTNPKQRDRELAALTTSTWHRS